VLFLVLAVPVVAYLGLRLYGPLKGAYWRGFRTPALVLDSRVEDLVAARASAQRERLLEVWRKGRGTYGLRRTVSSIEGTPIGLTLVADQGRATLVLDYTRDSYGNREFFVESVQTIDLVLPNSPSGVETPGETQSPDKARLRCLIEGREPIQF